MCSYRVDCYSVTDGNNGKGLDLDCVRLALVVQIRGNISLEWMLVCIGEEKGAEESEVERGRWVMECCASWGSGCRWRWRMWDSWIDCYIVWRYKNSTNVN
jgi:hypothetical protein